MYSINSSASLGPMNGLSHSSSFLTTRCGNTTTLPSPLRQRRCTERARLAQTSSAPMIVPGGDFSSTTKSPEMVFLKVPKVPSMTMKISLACTLASSDVGSAGSARTGLSLSSERRVPRVPNASIRFQLMCFDTMPIEGGKGCASSPGVVVKMVDKRSSPSKRSKSAGFWSNTTKGFESVCSDSSHLRAPSSTTPSGVGTNKMLPIPNSNAKSLREKVLADMQPTSLHRRGFCMRQAWPTRS
mmetsp:Transcript_70892/g.179419  ORF Transcript_70892/g.179419 Transcript_70892/m.179419 type:complete len:242 (-) Transcript_70892:516-1241(-)